MNTRILSVLFAMSLLFAVTACTNPLDKSSDETSTGTTVEVVDAENADTTAKDETVEVEKEVDKALDEAVEEANKEVAVEKAE